MFLPVSVTNRVNTSNQATDAVLAADTGTGFTPLPVSGQVSNTSITFNGINFTIPASGSFSLKISNIRGAVYQLGATNTQAIRAQLAFSGSPSVSVNQSFVVVAFAQPGLTATLFDRGQITCVGSPLPTTINLANLFTTGTNFASARVTEGFAAAFQPRGPGEDSGTRILLKYSGFPANAHIYLPDMVAGSGAAVPTAGGDLGTPQAVGQYVPGSGTLLLARVLAPDTSGAGGFLPAAPAGTGPVALNSVSEVPLTNGSGFAVYEVLDANSAAMESAQIPTFIGLANVTAAAVASESVQIAPVSTVMTASTSAPIPRFASVQPASDCTAIGDCNADYFPKLSVTVASTPIQLTAVAGGALTSQPGYIPIRNAGGGVMAWNATVQYTSGTSGWANLDYTSGVNAGSVRVFVNTAGLAAGAYQANVIIDGGPMAGNVTIPVVLTVSAAPAGSGSGSGSGTGSGGSGSGSGGSGSGTGGGTTTTSSAVTVSRVVNAATFESTPLVAGSLGTIMGSNFNGKNVAVTFDGTAANLLYIGAGQINLQVPASLAGKNSATMVVSVDGVSSAPQTVILAAAWPAIFAGGVLNQDNSVNGPGSGATTGSILQIYATGIPDGATVSVQIGSQKGLVPLYAGPAPTVPGVQQVNVAVPDGVTADNSKLVVCANTATFQSCTAGYGLVVQ